MDLPPALTAALQTTTNARIFPNPFSIAEALANLRQLLALPSARLGVAGEAFFEELASVATTVEARGNLAHDAEIVALMKEHGVPCIVTADRDFLRFGDIQVTLGER